MGLKCCAQIDLGQNHHLCPAEGDRKLLTGAGYNAHIFVSHRKDRLHHISAIARDEPNVMPLASRLSRSRQAALSVDQSSGRCPFRLQRRFCSILIRKGGFECLCTLGVRPLEDICFSNLFHYKLPTYVVDTVNVNQSVLSHDMSTSTASSRQISHQKSGGEVKPQNSILPVPASC